MKVVTSELPNLAMVADYSLSFKFKGLGKDNGPLMPYYAPPPPNLLWRENMVASYELGKKEIELQQMLTSSEYNERMLFMWENK